LQRQRVKRLIFDLEREHAGVKASMLRALGNVAARHLLDTRLNPLPELVPLADTASGGIGVDETR
jgi:tRNA(Ile)-lysidine synthase TilS/MesJ